jgi:hypothetical protein
MKQLVNKIPVAIGQHMGHFSTAEEWCGSLQKIYTSQNFDLLP